MAELAPIAFVLVFAAIVGLAAWLLIRTARRNRAARDPEVSRDLARLAADRGWRFTPRDDRFLRRFDAYPFARGGRLRPALDLVTGTHRGRTFSCFQFAPPRSLPPGDGSAEIDHARVVAVSLPVPVPGMLVTPARAAPRWTREYTVGDDAFDRTFAVGTEDVAFAERVLTEPVRRWLLDNPPVGSVRFGGTDVVAWHADRGGFDARAAESAVNHLCDLLDRIPPDALR